MDNVIFFFLLILSPATVAISCGVWNDRVRTRVCCSGRISNGALVGYCHVLAWARKNATRDQEIEPTSAAPY